jgi:putative hemolysin
MEILVLFGLIVLNGLFAMSEIALVTARKGRLSKMAEDGDVGADAALRLGEDPTRFLSTVQIGITSISILNGIVGESVLAEPLALWLQSKGMLAGVAGLLATVLVVVAVTYVSIVVGELVPKRLGQISPDLIAAKVARPMRLLAFLTRPFVFLLTFSTHGILRLFGVHQRGAGTVTEEEIHAILEEGSEAGVIEKQEHEMVRNVFRLDDRQLGSLLVPRSEIVLLDASLSREENLLRVVESGHSRFPVCAGDPDTLLGVVSAKQLLVAEARGEKFDLRAHAHPCIYVPESLTGMELLDKFRDQGAKMAFVIDEFGGLQGLVTLQDLLESVMGEFPADDADESLTLQREDGSWLLDGGLSVLELKDRLGLKGLPDEDRGHYHTLGGLVMLLLGNVPKTGDIVHWEDWKLEVVDMDAKRIDKVLAMRVPAATI